MHRRTGLSAGLGLLLGASLAACGALKPPERIVLVVVDTLRRDVLGCYGGDAGTPTVDRLAREGQVFSQAMASFHQTTMSMGAIFTGRTPSLETGDLESPLAFVGRTWCGLARFDPGNVREECVPPGLATLGEQMSRAGYTTIGITSNALLFDPYGLSRGFDDWTEVGEVPVRGTMSKIVAALPTRAAPKVNEAVAQAIARRRDDRFFLYVHYMDVHDYQVQDLPDERPADRSREKYLMATGDVDRALSELLAMLDADGLLDDAVVVFTSDHGERLGERHFFEGRPTHIGNPAFEEVLEVPLVVWPARFASPDALVRGIDLFGMLGGLAGIPERTNPPELQAGEVFTSEYRWLTYRRGRFKSYTRRHARGLWLVDLASDPAESRNVAFDNPEVAQVHWDRVSALSTALSASTSGAGGLTERDAARLRALGYTAPKDAASSSDEELLRPSGALAGGKERPQKQDRARGWRPSEG